VLGTRRQPHHPAISEAETSRTLAAMTELAGRSRQPLLFARQAVARLLTGI